jgi:hypothetical protein
MKPMHFGGSPPLSHSKPWANKKRPGTDELNT